MSRSRVFPHFFNEGSNLLVARSSLNIFLQRGHRTQNKLNRSRGAQLKASHVYSSSHASRGHGGGDVLHFDPSKKQSDHKRNCMHAAKASRRSRIHKGPSTRARGSPHIWFFTVMLNRLLEQTALLTQGTINVADKGRAAAVTTLRQIGEQQTAKEMPRHLRPGVQASPSVRQAWERTSVAASFRVERKARSRTS